jgi:hypothetical protein
MGLIVDIDEEEEGPKKKKIKTGQKSDSPKVMMIPSGSSGLILNRPYI